ncbi:hypothetical protein GQ464_006080 [Rhodocaloribacter litoris]|uniref:hypothetical protein n=1 Tax=Rhodocaloribacter litoris TaxID=2558931 RepID=UPI001E2DF70A|nr:hypothetical protein [Rhodocaloribacter litoris]QXD16514.1 hypothetical protein GQ464_006080 [Rhodocaloribacter litoris]
MNSPVCFQRRFLGPLLLLVLLPAGCDDTVNPFEEEDRYFTLFGFLDTAADTQFVRVIPLRTTLLPEGPEPLDVHVTTTALPDGRVQVWRDSVIQYADGSFGHVFYAPMQVFPSWTYRFEVRRADGATTTAETTVPPATNVRVAPPAGLSRPEQTVLWEGIDFPPFRVEVWYRFASFPPTEPFREVVVVYGEERYGRRVEGGWQVNVALAEDRRAVLAQLGEPLTLLGVGMRLTMSDDRWRPPGGVFDPELLVQPGTFSNVENGFGFLGAVNQFTAEWTLPEPVVTALGYAYPGKRF